MEPPPNIWEFDRYSKHCKPAADKPMLHASRVANGELVDESGRLPSRVLVGDGHMKLYNSYSDVSAHRC
jgi:hypothetical protein